MKRLPVIVAVVFLVLLGCSEDETIASAPADGNVTPTMVTDSVNSFVSDSGVTRYHLVTPLWLMYDEADDPFWRFPQGLDLEQYDDGMVVNATVTADSAIYYSRRKIWQLDGNVRMRNLDGDKFLTEQLFWDQRNHKVYSDSFIHIERAERIIEGYGFVSNEEITSYTIRRPTGIFPTDGFQQRRDSVASPSTPDSVNPAVTPSPKPMSVAKRK